MALFKRADLEAKGLNKEQIEYIMTESGGSLGANYVLSSDVQARIDEAVKAVKPDPVDVKTTPEYAEILRERDMLRAIGGEEFQAVKPKFREQVYGMLDRSEKAKPISEQLTAIKEKFEEYYVPEPTPAPKPQFGSPDKGTMPKGNDSAADAISKAWGFGPQK